MHIAPHHSEQQTNYMNKVLTIGYHPGKIAYFYSTFPHGYYNHGLHNFNITTDHQEAIQLAQARDNI